MKHATTNSDSPVESETSSKTVNFPIVGVGASAGGLAAFEAFFSALPNETESGMAFVLVQHLAPDHKSLLTDLVRRYTHLQVYEVEDGMKIEPNCTYIIPPNYDMALLNGHLQLLEQSTIRGIRLPIDYFFQTLAEDLRERAIGIVLSGTGSDGTSGIRAIKAEGGMVMAQLPESTEYDGMPSSAIATGLVDFILPPADMPAQLITYVKNAFCKIRRNEPLPKSMTDDAKRKVCIILRDKTRHDFSQYKDSTLNRRIERRMALHQIETMSQYVQFLQANGAEVEALFRDLLIGVTRFFRDPEAFKTLEDQVIPKIFNNKPPGSSIRIWVCGCSTGEEAYSIGILLQEYMESVRQVYYLQIFATDIDAQAVNQARKGVFPMSIAADISPERLKRFFIQDADSSDYRIQKNIRDVVIFSEQNVIKDPPFSKLDLISCRNLLIYFNGALQKKLIPLFHYALNPSGVLFLGSSETIGEFVSLFGTLDAKERLFQRREDPLYVPSLEMKQFDTPLGKARINQSSLAEQGVSIPNLRTLTEQALLGHYAQAAALINNYGDILHIYGRTGKYLEPAPGDAVMNILPMAREGLHRELVTALHRATALKELIRYTGLQVKTNGDFTTVDLTVKPVVVDAGQTPLPDLYLVLLEEPSESIALEVVSTDEHGDAESTRRIAFLEQELRVKEDYLQSTLEEMQTSNEELKSSNEEMQSINEELQSTNEELETSKEELQSVNEELATVNAELQAKVGDLSRVNNDMNNLLAGTGLATLFVDLDLKITRFTPATTQLINLIQTDIGRPVAHIVSNLVEYNRLEADLNAVLDTLETRETEVKTKVGTWFLMRIRPYRTLENSIEGAVIIFVDITERKRMEVALRDNETRLNALFDQAIAGIAQLDLNGNFQFVNEQQCKKLGYSPAELLKMRILDLIFPEDLARVEAQFLALATDGQDFHAETRFLGKDGSPVWVNTSVNGIRDKEGRVQSILVVSIDSLLPHPKQESKHQIT